MGKLIRRAKKLVKTVKKLEKKRKSNKAERSRKPKASPRTHVDPSLFEPTRRKTKTKGKSSKSRLDPFREERGRREHESWRRSETKGLRRRGLI